MHPGGVEENHKQGRGAYYSSGSRPNQTARSWGLARLASSITGGPAAKVDFHIIDESCDHDKPAHKLAVKPKPLKPKKIKVSPPLKVKT
jgi:hypothetical protein